VIDDQVRKQDRAGWRTRAFVLALTGDTAGAMNVVRSVMPGQAAAMEPFIARLSSLNDADRAMAVNFGHFPGSDAAAAAQPVRNLTPTPSEVSLATAAGTPDPRQVPLGSAQTRPSPPPAAPPTAAPASAQSSPLGGSTAAVPTASSSTSSTTTSTAGLPPTDITAVPVPASVAAALPIASGGLDTAAAPAPTVTAATDQASAAMLGPTAGASQSAPSSVASFADVAALVAELPAGESGEREVAVTAASIQSPPARAAAPAGEPSRIWVQIASVGEQASMPSEYNRLKALAPNVFDGKRAWSSPARATNRLLVGPFVSEAEAQAFVDQLTKAKLAGFAWTSSAGQPIARLSVK
jgi:hypothetical protein